MQFFKMQNQGNDYIFVFEKPSKEEIVNLCDRNFGVGGDGVVYFYLSGNSYCYEIYNKDGTSASFCGSVTLCLGLYIYKKYGKNNCLISSDCGKKRVKARAFSKGVRVEVDMGKPKFFVKEKLFNRLMVFYANGERFLLRASVVDVGNLHLVVRGLFSEDKRRKIVNAINQSARFSSGINIEFVQRLSPSKVRVVVYERGSGKTLCCSSGGCAVFYLLNKLGHLNDKAQIIFDGGTICAQKNKKGVVISSYPKFIYFGNRCEL